MKTLKEEIKGLIKLFESCPALMELEWKLSLGMNDEGNGAR